MIDLYCERTVAGLWAEPVNNHRLKPVASYYSWKPD